MKPLEPPHTHYLNAAQGWLLFGNLGEAEAELDRLEPVARAHPDVLEVRYEIHAAREDWAGCFAITQRVLQQVPERAFGWIHGAYAVRRMAGGGLAAAFEALVPAATLCPQEPIVFFNLACYACQLGRLDEAWEWLQQAAKLSSRARIIEMARQDDDLAPLRDRLAKL
ncbi:hypothetical protein LBMAG56_38840 [Verrucomicrobiota bacterium]|nr:hypothetical protein LBMAG56_38840 [Verrucomicrobiota bacterium]